MNWAILIAALIAVESGGNPQAIGDNGRAVGVLQIWPCVVEDVNRISGRHYSMEDRLDVDKSKSICIIYLRHYGKGKSWEQRARIWNGGPRGDRKAATLPYWERVERAAKSISSKSHNN